jgi:hypothetical protein
LRSWAEESRGYGQPKVVLKIFSLDQEVGMSELFLSNYHIDSDGFNLKIYLVLLQGGLG